MFFAWAFEATPEGIKRESEIDRSQSITRTTGRKLDRAIIVMLVIALAYFVWESRVATRAPVDTPTETSVAVLAFENMSPDPTNEYFAEGVSEEILNVLAAVDGLRVASRTSAFSFADSDTPIPEIASQLDVANVLEGSVRRQGMRVRITAQLIDATTDTHLWSETYDRDLDDIFVVQEEIAAAMSEALMGALGMQQVEVKAPTNDMAAYELFLRGRQQFYARGEGSLRSAVADLEAAVARDPDFAEAWSFLAASLRTLSGYVTADIATIHDYWRRSEEAAERALALDPQQALAVAVQGLNAGESDRIKGLALLDRAVAMAPGDAGLLMWAGNQRFYAGAVNEALPLLERAYRLDPLSGINNGVLGMAYLATGKRDLAYQHMQRAIELNWPHTARTMTLDLLQHGEAEKALATARMRYPANESTWWTDTLKAKWETERLVLRGELTADELVKRIESTSAINRDTHWQVLVYRFAGDLERMFDAWLATDYDADYLLRLVFVPGGREVMEHPRMLDVARKLLLLPVWESTGYPFGCVRMQDEIGDHLRCSDWPE